MICPTSIVKAPIVHALVTVCFLFLLFFVSLTNAVEVPNKLVSGTTAKASDVNENFDYLADRSWESGGSGALTNPSQPSARAYGTDLIDYPGPPNRVGKNDYIRFEDFDVGGNLDVVGGPTFTAPVTGTYLVNYRQGFRNPASEPNPPPEHWQYGIFLRVNGTNNYSYYSIISDFNHTDDYIYTEFTDIIQLNAGDIIEAMESVDFGPGGVLQKATGAFGVVLLH